MRRFKSAAHAQRFLLVHGLVLNLFRVGRHLLQAAHYRWLRTRSLLVWQEVTFACCDLGEVVDRGTSLALSPST